MKKLDVLYEKIVKSCPKCDNGIIVKNNEFVDCECLNDFKKQSKIVLSNVPRKYIEFDLRNLTADFTKHNQTPLNIIKKYVGNINKNIEQGNGLFFQSEAGLAKTSLSCYILLQAIGKDFKAFFIKYSDLIALLFKLIGYEEDNIEAQEKLDYMLGADIICVDRIDKGYVDSEYVCSRMDEVFSSIYDDMKALVVTSGIPREELKERISFSSALDELVDIVFIGGTFRSSNKTLRNIMDD